MACSLDFQEADCPIARILLYTDGADITRHLKIVPTATGNFDVKIYGITPSAIKDSIRVTGTGSATVNEVVCELEHSLVGTGVESEVKQIALKIDELRWNVLEIQNEIEATYSKQEQSAILLKSTCCNPCDLGSAFDSSDHLYELVALNHSAKLVGPSILLAHPEIIKGEFSSIMERMDTHEKLLITHSDHIIDLEEKKSALLIEIESLIQKLKEKSGDNFRPTENNMIQNINKILPKFKRQKTEMKIMVNIDIRSTSWPVEFEISYLINPGKARWEPVYRIRAEMNESEEEGDDLMPFHLDYFGEVAQNTAEDWNDVEIILSTTPFSSASATPPQLPRKSIGWKKSAEVLLATNGGTLANPGRVERSQRAEGASAQEAVATSFIRLPMKTTIKADNKKHKVLITTLTLNAKILLYALPSIDNCVYQIGEAKNTSEFSFMRSSQCSVFIDDSFISTSSMDAVSPGETLTLFLGIDANMCLTASPFKQQEKEVGIYKVKQTDVEYIVHVKNKHSSGQRRRLTLCFPFPRSVDDKIKVKLLKPQEEVEEISKIRDIDAALESFKQNDQHLKPILNKVTNHILVTKTLSSQQTSEITYKYEIKSPLNQDLYFYNVPTNPRKYL